MSKYSELKEKYKGKRIILHVASYLSPMKGTEYAIEAMGYVNKEFPEAMLIIITSHRQIGRKYELMALARKCHAEIHFETGVKDEDMPAYYSLAEVLLAPSLDENVHLPQLEAQSCGCPVITFRGKKETEEIVNKVTGYRVDDYYEMGVFTCILLREDIVRKERGIIAHQFILDNFAWDKCIENYKRIIKEVVWSKRKRVFN